MTYIFTCDGWCGSVHHDRPALMSEFNESWFKSTRAGGELEAAGFSPGDVVTLCGACTERLLVAEP